MAADPLISALQAKIAENDAAQKRLRRERAFLESQLRQATEFFPDPRERKEDDPQPQLFSKKRRSDHPHFKPIPGGPTETLLRIVEEADGQLDRRNLLVRAVTRVTTASGDPARSLAETLRQLISKKRLYEDEDGRISLPGGIEP